MAQLKDSLITGDLRVTGTIYGNATSATKLQNARTIAISGGATGTATSFDGSGNITIPVTGLDMSKANAGTLPVGRGGTGATTFTANRVLLGNGTSAIKVGNVNYTEAAGTKGGTKYMFRVWGTTVGNAATELVSQTAGVMRFGDAGPQIQFSSAETGGQQGALIFTDHDSSGAGVSWHFVSDQSDNNNGGNATVTAPRFRARAGLTIGQNSDDTGYNLKVNGTSHLNGNTTITGNLIFPTANIFDWNNGTYKQRLTITDDSTADTQVFTFQQSTNSGSSYNNLLTIRDNGKILLQDNIGGIYKLVTAATDTPVIQVSNNNFDVSILKIDGNNRTSHVTTQSYGFNLKYIGTGAGEANSLDLIADNTDGTDVIGISVSNAGRVGIGSKYDGSYRLKTNSGDVLINDGLLKIVKNSNTVTIGSQNTSFTHIYNSANIPFIFNKDILVTDKHNLGNASWPFGNLYLSGANNGIYYQGSKALNLMIKMLDNAEDAYGNGIRIGAGGVVVVGAGESGDSLISAKSLAAGTETLFLTSDGTIYAEAGGDTIANRIGIEINSSGHIIPVKAENGNNNAQNLGSTSYRWANIYATNGNFNGSLIAPTDNNMISHGNEFNYVPTLTANTEIHINHRQTGGNNTDGFKITKYHFKDGAGGLLATISSGQFSGNAATATKLATARSINGTNFDGSANITTANWGTARNISIADSDGTNTGSAVSVNGSANATLKLPATIKATLTGHASLDLPLAGGTMTGQIKSTKAGGSWIQGRNNACLYQTLTTSNNWHPVVGFKTPNGSWTIGNVGDNENCVFSYDTDTNFNANTNTTIQALYFDSNGYIHANRVYNAVWNDYAEFRKTAEAQPGQCVREVGDGSLVLTTKRLEKGCEIISDTYGFAIGETDEYKTPIAATGRVLAYPYEDIEEFKTHIGDPVCSGPNGTVSIMTEKEEEKYPSRIIGTISEIPTYETWGTGNVEVNGRVWIRIK